MKKFYFLFSLIIFWQSAYAQWNINRSISTQRGNCLIESEKIPLEQGNQGGNNAQAYFIVTPKSITLRTTLLVDPMKSNIQIDGLDPLPPDRVSLHKFLIFESTANNIIEQMKTGQKLKIHLRSKEGGAFFAEIPLKAFSKTYTERERCQARPIK